MFDLEELRRIYMALKVWMYECNEKQRADPGRETFYGNEYMKTVLLKDKIRVEIFKYTGVIED